MINAAIFKRSRPWVLGVSAAILLAAFLVRLIGIDGRWMWFDELLTGTFVAYDLPNTLVTNLRFDIHPPLYYFQLSLWTLGGHSDLWLMLNTVLWSAAAVALLMWRVRRVYDLQTAWIACGLLAFSSAALVFGDQVRMYAFLMVMILWTWIALEDWLKAERTKRFPWKASLNVIASQTAVVYSHSAGIVMISGCILYAAYQLLREGDLRTRIHWVLTETCVAVLAVPTLVLVAVRAAGHPVAPGLDEILHTWRFLAAGELGVDAIGAAMGVLLLAILVWFGFVRAESRVAILTLIFAPLVIAAAISYVKPIWLDRIFVTLIPFICLYVALFVVWMLRTAGMAGRVAAVALAMLWAGVGIAGQMTREKGDGYKPAAAYAHQVAQPGDIVLVDGDFGYWCFMWYYSGPRWGYPQQAAIIMPKWQALIDRLGPTAAQLLGFNEQKRSVDVNGVTAVMWDRQAPVPLDAPTVLAVRSNGAPPLDLPGFALAATQVEKDLTVETWKRIGTP
ncbi:MAG: glycosyltransferase family 39 protein [Hyphomonadaceae bacterium]|nr:glycosyltransferase family 39 protein [Hyphomonadaceae bacterium]